MEKELLDLYFKQIDEGARLLKEEIEKQEDFSIRAKTKEGSTFRALSGYVCLVHTQRCLEASKELRQMLEDLKTATLQGDSAEVVQEKIPLIDGQLDRLARSDELLRKGKEKWL